MTARLDSSARLRLLALGFASGSLVGCAEADPWTGGTPGTEETAASEVAVGQQQQRLWNGYGTTPGKRYYTVALFRPDVGFYCSGVYVAHWWVLTAAHCVYPEDLDAGIYVTALRTPGKNFPSSRNANEWAEVTDTYDPPGSIDMKLVHLSNALWDPSISDWMRPPERSNLELDDLLSPSGSVVCMGYGPSSRRFNDGTGVQDIGWFKVELHGGTPNGKYFLGAYGYFSAGYEIRPGDSGGPCFTTYTGEYALAGIMTDEIGEHALIASTLPGTEAGDWFRGLWPGLID